MPNEALDQLTGMTGLGADAARDYLSTNPGPTELPEQTSQRVAAQQAAQIRTNRYNAGDLAGRGIPSFEDETGNVQPVKDGSGATVNHYDKSSNIGYDGAGKPVELSYNSESGPPELKDPFAGLPTTTDQKTGDQYKIRKGLPWQWQGKDEDVAAQAAQAERTKVVDKAASELGRKLTLDEKDAKHAEADFNTGKKELLGMVPTLAGVTNKGAKREDVLAGIHSYFDEQEKSPEANATAGWFNHTPSPEAIAFKSQLKQGRDAAVQKANQLFDLGDGINAKRADIENSRYQAQQLAAIQAESQKQRLSALGINLDSLSQARPDVADAAVAADSQMDDGKRQAISEAVAGKKPYTVTSNGVQMQDGQLLSGAKQALADGLVDPAFVWQHEDQFAKADAAYADLVKSAGGNAAVKAFLSNAGKGAASAAGGAALAGSLEAPNAAVAGFTGPAAPLTFGALNIVEFMAGMGLTAFALNKAQQKASAYSEAIKSLTASEALHPVASEAGNITGMLFGGRVDKSLASLIQIGKIASVDGGAAAAIAGRVIPGAAAGAAFEAAARPAFDYIVDKGADALNIEHNPTQAPTVRSVAENAAIGAFLSGLHVKFYNLQEGQIAYIIQRGGLRENAGVDLHADLPGAGPGLSASEKAVYEAAKKARDRVSGTYGPGDDVKLSARQAQAGGNPIATAVDVDITPQQGLGFTPPGALPAPSGSPSQTPPAGGNESGNAPAQPQGGNTVSAPAGEAGRARSERLNQIDIRLEQIKHETPTPETDHEREALVSEREELAKTGQSKTASEVSPLSRGESETQSTQSQTGQSQNTPPPTQAGKSESQSQQPDSQIADGDTITNKKRRFTVAGREDGSILLQPEGQPDAEPLRIPAETVEKQVAAGRFGHEKKAAPVIEPDSVIVADGQRYTVIGSDAQNVSLRPEGISEGNPVQIATADIHESLKNGLYQLEKPQPKEGDTTNADTSEAQKAVPANEGKTSPENGGSKTDAVEKSGARQDDGNVSVATAVDQAAHDAATSPRNELAEPTNAQKEAGNYQMGHATISGLPITIENPAESTRHDTKNTPPKWETVMKDHYGYIKRTEGADSTEAKRQGVDVFVKPGTPETYSGPVFVIEQHNPKTGAFDEHKAVIGAANKAEASEIYHRNYQSGWKGAGEIREFSSVEDFKKWLPEAKRDNPGKLEPGQQRKSDPITGNDALSHIKELVRVAKPQLDALGVEKVEYTQTPNESGIFFDSKNRRLLIDPAKVARSMEAVRDEQARLGIQGEPKDWLGAAMLHEVIHAADEAVAREKGQSLQERYEALSSDALPKGWDDAGAKAYGEEWETLPEWKQKAEFARMVLEGKYTGKITEAFYKVLRDVLDFIKRTFTGAGDVFKTHLSEIEARLEKARETSKTPSRAVNRPLLLGEGDIVRTLSGRETSPFPRVDATTERKTASAVRRVDEWLLKEAIAEAQARGDKFNLTQFRGEKVNNLPPASKDAMNLYLFGHEDGPSEIVRSAQKPTEKRMLPSKPDAPKKIASISDEANKALDEAFDGLGTAKPTVATVEKQTGIPEEKFDAFLKAARSLIRSGIEKPEEMARVLDEKFPDGRMRKYSQALWNAFGMARPELSGVHDWQKIYLTGAKEIQQPESKKEIASAPAAESSDESDPKQQPEKEHKFRGSASPDFDEHPVVSTLLDHGGIVSKSQAQKRFGAEKWEANKGEWDDAPYQMENPTHNKIYQPNGLQPDEATQVLIDAGLLPENATAPDMWKAIADASNGAESLRKQRGAQNREMQEGEKQHEAFDRDREKKDRGEKEFSTWDLTVGDVLLMDGEKLKVVSEDQDSVTLEDGKKYGRQTLETGQVIYAKKAKKAEPQEKEVESESLTGKSESVPKPNQTAAQTKPYLQTLGLEHDIGALAQHSPELMAKKDFTKLVKPSDADPSNPAATKFHNAASNLEARTALNNLSQSQLKGVAEQYEWRTGGTQNELVARLIHHRQLMRSLLDTTAEKLVENNSKEQLLGMLKSIGKGGSFYNKDGAAATLIGWAKQSQMTYTANVADHIQQLAIDNAIKEQKPVHAETLRNLVGTAAENMGYRENPETGNYEFSGANPKFHEVEGKRVSEHTLDRMVREAKRDISGTIKAISGAEKREVEYRTSEFGQSQNFTNTGTIHSSTLKELEELRKKLTQQQDRLTDLESIGREKNQTLISSASNEVAKTDTLTFEDFKKQYLEAFNQLQKYKPNEVGSHVFAEKMAALSDAHPDWAEKVESETKSPAPEPKKIEKPARALVMQAKVTSKVNADILETGKWPNGKKVTEADREKLLTEQEANASVLKAAGEPALNEENFGITGKATPAIERYIEIKRTLPKGTLALMKMGDFYEAFGDDAKTLSRELKITLTKRNETPMAGIPQHAAESYIKKLGDAGIKTERFDGPKPNPKANFKKAESPEPETPKPANGELLGIETKNTSRAVAVSDENGSVIVRVGGQPVATLSQDAKSKRFKPTFNEQGQQLDSEQLKLVMDAADKFTSRYQAEKIKEGQRKKLAANNLVSQGDLLDDGQAEDPLFQQPRKPEQTELSNSPAAPNLPASSPELDSAEEKLFDGLFAARPVSRAIDTSRQLDALNAEAISRGYSDADEWATQQPLAVFGAAQKWRERHPTPNGLGTASPDEQKPIPRDKSTALVAYATQLLDAGIDTPEALAQRLETKFGGKARPYTQAVWRMMQSLGADDSVNPSWTRVYSSVTKSGDLTRNDSGDKDEQRSSPNLEPNQPRGTTGNGRGASGVPAQSGSNNDDAGGVDESRDRGTDTAKPDSELAGSSTDDSGARGNNELREQKTGAERGVSGDQQPEGGRNSNAGGVEPDQRRESDPATTLSIAGSGATMVDGGAGSDEIAGILKSVPSLKKEQAGDVAFIEKRLFRNGKQGVLLTNGTGTGKTFSGFGAIKRALDRGAKHIAIIVPSDGIGMAWMSAARDFFGVSDVAQLLDTKDNGKGNRVIVTTYANFGVNNDLVKRPWDMIVSDEAHFLTANKDGERTLPLNALRALTLHPEGVYRRTEMLEPEAHRQLEAYRQAEHAFLAKKGPALTDEQRADRDRITSLVSATQAQVEKQINETSTENKPKVILLSATPFAYRKSVDYGNGYLFDYPEPPKETVGRYNSPSSPRDLFLMENFGYRMRYGKLTEPENPAATGILERRFAERLMREGATRGRALDVDKDYSRDFILTENALGGKIDEIMDAMWKNSRTRVLSEHLGIGNYLERRMLLEALKARDSIDRIRDHRKLGRKVVVFHDYKVGGAINPLRPRFDPTMEVSYYEDGKHHLITLGEAYEELRENVPHYDDTAGELDGLLPPISQLQEAFGDALRIYNGDVPKKERRKAVVEFNTSGGDTNVILVQRDAGKQGISLHDTDGKHQRVFIDLGIPAKPTDAIQSEGRIYRLGVRSDAVMEYLITGTNFERWTFAQTIANRASTAENLAMGEKARALLQSFADGFNDAAPGHPSRTQGTGGKEKDASRNNPNPYKDAIALYFTNQKKTSRNKASEGVDYFPTPEPLGFKMMEWTNYAPGEKGLEPSAGHGAIARFFPDSITRHAIEPSRELSGRLALNATDVVIHEVRFEDYNIVNKFDGIDMNPPFGVGGSTAIAHLAKAAKHLKNGGRIVAIIPEGPSADAKFNKWFFDKEETKNLVKMAEFGLPGVTFERGGTKVKARVVVIDRYDQEPDRIKADSKSQERIDISGDTIEEFFTNLENRSVPDRIEVAAQTPEPAEQQSNEELAKGLTSTRNFVLPNNPQTGIPAPANPNTYAADSFSHTKTGQTVFVAKITRRLADEEYKAAKALATKQGGYYSTFKGAGAIPGFHFKTAEARDAFISVAQKPEGLGAAAVSNLENQAIARYQWMGNKEGGQKSGNRQIIVRGTEPLFQKYVRPLIRDGFGETLASHEKMIGEKIYLSFISRDGGKWELGKIADLNDLKPRGEAVQKGWAIPVKSFDSDEATKHRAAFDSDASVSKGDRVRDESTGKTGKVTHIKGSKAVVALDEGGNAAVPMKMLKAAGSKREHAVPEQDEFDLAIPVPNVSEGLGAAAIFSQVADEMQLRGARNNIAGKHDAARNLADYKGEHAASSIRLDFPNKTDREAMPFVIEAGGDVRKLGTFRSQISASVDPKLAKKYLPLIDHAISNLARLDAKKANHERMMRASVAELRAAGVDIAEVEDYVTRKLDAPENVRAALPNPLFGMGSGNGSSPRYFTKGRSFVSLAEAIANGFAPKSTDLAELDGHRIAAGRRIINQRRMLEELRHTLSPTDGRPIIGRITFRRLAGGGTEPSVPRGYITVNGFGQPLIVHEHFATLFRDLFGDSAVRRSWLGRGILKGAAFAKHYTLVFDTFHVGRLLFKMATAGGGLPLTVREGGRPGFNIHNGLAGVEYSDADLGRAVAAGEITRKEADYARRTRPMAEELMSAGLNVGRVADNLVKQAGLHVPGFDTVLKGVNNWIFGKLSRAAMWQSSIAAFERNLENRVLTRAEAARRTAVEMNELFGNLQNQGVFKSKTLQDLMRIIFLAPQWTESQFRYEARAYGQAGKGAFNFATGGGAQPPAGARGSSGRTFPLDPRNLRFGNAARAFAFGFVALLAVNQVINYLTRKKSTFENPEDGHKLDAWIPGGKHGFWFNPFEIAGEYAHAAMKYLAQHEHPIDVASHIVSNKLAPFSRGTKELLTGRDYAGRHFLSDSDRVRSAVTTAFPFPMPANMAFERDPRAPLGYRLTRQPAAVQKQLMQSGGAKVTAAQSPRTQMFEIAQPFRPDRGNSDNAGEYTELRRAIDNDDSAAAVAEIKWLVGRGKSPENIRSAFGILKDGTVKPEQFAGGADREKEMLKTLTPKEKQIYGQAQTDHVQNAMKLQRLMATAKTAAILSRANPIKSAAGGNGHAVWSGF